MSRQSVRSRALAEFDDLDLMDQVHLGVHQAKRMKPDAYREALASGELNPSIVLANIELVRRLCAAEAEVGRLMRSFTDATQGGRRRALSVVDGVA